MTVAGKRSGHRRGAGIGAALVAELRIGAADVVGLDVSSQAEIVCDVSDGEQVTAVFSEIRAVDGLVNDAALLVNRQPYDAIGLDEWDRMFAV